MKKTGAYKHMKKNFSLAARASNRAKLSKIRGLTKKAEFNRKYVGTFQKHAEKYKNRVEIRKGVIDKSISTGINNVTKVEDAQ